MNSLDPIKTIDSLKKIIVTTKEIPSWIFPSEEVKQIPSQSSTSKERKEHDVMENKSDKEKISILQDIIENMNYSVVLDYLFANNLEKLIRIQQKLKKGTEFSGYIELLVGICRDETDFDFLTEPEKCAFYDRLFLLAEKTEKQIPRYVNILKEICENKRDGIYREGQEIDFFMKEYDQKEESISDIDFVHLFKKVLTLKSQKIFDKLFGDSVFEATSQIFASYKSNISDEETLCFFIYGSLYYKELDLSNENEKIFLHHLKCLIDYLMQKDPISFEKPQKANPKSFEKRIESLFRHENPESPERLIGLLKDYSLNDAEVVTFLEKLKGTFRGENISFDFTENINVISEIVSDYHENSAFKWLNDIFEAQLKKIGFTEKDLKILEPIFEQLTLQHFFQSEKQHRLSSDMDFVRQNRSSFSRSYEVTSNLMQKNIFSLIVFVYKYEKPNARQAAEFIADSYFKAYFSDDNDEKKKYVILIEFLYSMVIEKFFFHFDVGDKVRTNGKGAIGEIIQILRRSVTGNQVAKDFYYRIRWESYDSDILVRDADRTISLAPISKSHAYNRTVIREKRFSFRKKDYIARQYTFAGDNRQYGIPAEIVYADNDEKFFNMQALALLILNSKGINILSQNTNTYKAIGMLLDFFDGKTL